MSIGEPDLHGATMWEAELELPFSHALSIHAESVNTWANSKIGP